MQLMELSQSWSRGKEMAGSCGLWERGSCCQNPEVALASPPSLTCLFHPAHLGMAAGQWSIWGGGAVAFIPRAQSRLVCVGGKQRITSSGILLDLQCVL